MKSRILSVWCVAIAGCLFLAGVAAAQNGLILDQQLDGDNRGYTVLRIWGSHYEMGYAQASLLGDYIVTGVAEMKALVGESDYTSLRLLMSASVWKPPEIEDELDGMVASLAVSHPSDAIDKVDLKVVNTYSDYSYACRSHICWGRYVTAPIKTLATRRLDFGSPTPTSNHHVLTARDPNDGSPRWVNLAWPGAVASGTGVNEFGTLVSLHDYNSTGADLSAGRMPRSVVARYALTFATGGDPSTHLTSVFSELQGYEIMTGGFFNYYAPEGHGGVMTADPYQTGPDFHDLRVPQAVWHHGEAMVTTNRRLLRRRDSQDPREPLGSPGGRRRQAAHDERRLPRAPRHDHLGRRQDRSSPRRPNAAARVGVERAIQCGAGALRLRHGAGDPGAAAVRDCGSASEASGLKRIARSRRRGPRGVGAGRRPRARAAVPGVCGPRHPGPARRAARRLTSSKGQADSRYSLSDFQGSDSSSCQPMW